MPHELTRHPLSKFWDDISGTQFAELTEDIKTFGLLHPITLFNGQVLDGWQRYRACRQLGKQPETKTFSGTPAGAASLVKSLNAHRRLMMTESQRALAIVEISQWVDGCEKGGGGYPGIPPPSAKTNAEMAKESGTSRLTVQRAKRVADQGSEELKAAVRSGAVPVKRAAAVMDKPKREQLAAAKAKPEKAAPPADLSEFIDEKGAEQEEREYADRIARVLDADDHLKQMNAELERAAKEIVALKQARDRYMNECGAMRKQLTAKDREIARLKKAAK